MRTDREVGPVVDALQRVSACTGGHVGVEVGRPTGGGWIDIARPNERTLEQLVGDAEREGAQAPDYVGASIAGRIGEAVLTPTWTAVLLTRRLPDVMPFPLAVHRHLPEGWFDRIAIGGEHCFVLPGDSAAGHPATTVLADLAALHSRLAEDLTAFVRPWFTAVRARSPFAVRGMWGQLADDLCGTALATARSAGLDAEAVWAEAGAVVDLLAAVVPEVKLRPRPFPVRWPGGEAMFQVRGTCCLWYKTKSGRSAGRDGYCTSCPLRDDESRHTSLVRWLEEEGRTIG
jgi:hypothetical protein